MELVTIAEAAKRLKCSVQTVRWWLNQHMSIKTELKPVVFERVVKRTRKVKHIDIDELKRLRGE